MTASQMRIAETIDAFYGDAGARDGVSRSYKQAVEDLDAETIKALDGPYRTTVLDPITRFCAYFPEINECMSLARSVHRCDDEADCGQASRSVTTSFWTTTRCAQRSVS